jgi:hypothetical protein
VRDDGRAALGRLGHVADRHRIESGLGDEPRSHCDDLPPALLPIDENWH